MRPKNRTCHGKGWCLVTHSHEELWWMDWGNLDAFIASYTESTAHQNHRRAKRSPKPRLNFGLRSHPTCEFSFSENHSQRMTCLHLSRLGTTAEHDGIPAPDTKVTMLSRLCDVRVASASTELALQAWNEAPFVYLPWRNVTLKWAPTDWNRMSPHTGTLTTWCYQSLLFSALVSSMWSENLSTIRLQCRWRGVRSQEGFGSPRTCSHLKPGVRMSQPSDHILLTEEATVGAKFLHSCYTLALQVPLTNTHCTNCC